MAGTQMMLVIGALILLGTVTVAIHGSLAMHTMTLSQATIFQSEYPAKHSGSRSNLCEFGSRGVRVACEHGDVYDPGRFGPV